jgi:probable HAF family extracellular repeat protein
MPAAVGESVTVDVQIADQGLAHSPITTVDWGDGLISGAKAHVYTAPGVYTLAISAANTNGESHSVLKGTVWIYDPAANHPSAPNYEAIDLGTLGGSVALPAALNNFGVIVGSSHTAANQLHPFVWKDGVMKDLGTLSLGGATRINDAGWIVGSQYAREAPAIAAWRNGSLVSVFGGGPDQLFMAAKVNDDGDILLNIDGHEEPDPWVLHANGIREPLGGLGSSGHGSSNDMNSHGQIVGQSAYRNADGQGYAYHAFLWDKGTMIDLGDLVSDGSSEAFDINERGQVVGWASGPEAIRAVIWDSAGSRPRDIGFGTGRSLALAINDHGQVAGHTQAGEGYFWNDGVVTNLGSLGGGVTYVTGMNEDGAVIGSSRTSSGDVHAFVWRRKTGMVDLGTGPRGAPGVWSVAVAINTRGDVIGYVEPCFAQLLMDNGQCAYADLPPSRGVLWRAEAVRAQ